MITQTITVINNYGVNLILTTDEGMMFSSSNDESIFGIGTTTYTSGDLTDAPLNVIGWDIYTEDKSIKVGELPELGIGNSAEVVVEANGDVEFNLVGIGGGNGGGNGGSSGGSGNGIFDTKNILIFAGVIILLIMLWNKTYIYRKLNQFSRRIRNNKNTNESPQGGVFDRFRNRGRSTNEFNF